MVFVAAAEASRLYSMKSDEVQKMRSALSNFDYSLNTQIATVNRLARILSSIDPLLIGKQRAVSGNIVADAFLDLFYFFNRIYHSKEIRENREPFLIEKDKLLALQARRREIVHNLYANVVEARLFASLANPCGMNFEHQLGFANKEFGMEQFKQADRILTAQELRDYKQPNLITEY